MDSGEETVEEGMKVMGMAEVTLLDMFVKRNGERGNEVSTSVE